MTGSIAMAWIKQSHKYTRRKERCASLGGVHRERRDDGGGCVPFGFIFVFQRAFLYGSQKSYFHFAFQRALLDGSQKSCFQFAFQRAFLDGSQKSCFHSGFRRAFLDGSQKSCSHSVFQRAFLDGSQKSCFHSRSPSVVVFPLGILSPTPTVRVREGRWRRRRSAVDRLAERPRRRPRRSWEN
jgi:hypothetical protein